MPSVASVRRLTALVAAVALCIASVPSTSAASTAGLEGRVLESPGNQPLGGVNVLLLDPKSEQLYTSAPTTSEGTFSVSDLPPASYHVAIQVNGGLYPVERPIALQAGQVRSVQLAVDPSAAQHQTGTETTRKRGIAALWDNPITAIFVLVGTAVVVGAIVDNIRDDDKPASPSSP
jgi:hypothetical protein